MARLFLIDHSLRDVGGHHFDFVRSVGGAARDAGVHVTIGCHRQFKRSSVDQEDGSSDSLAQIGDVRPVFHESVYQGNSWLAGFRQSKRTKPLLAHGNDSRKPGFWQRVQVKRLERRVRLSRDRIADRFAAGCDDFFSDADVGKHDQVFVASASELEIAGAVKFMRRNPAAQNAHWHFLFHLNIFDGWTSDYPSQSSVLSKTRLELLRAFRGFSTQRIHFHATTETLTDQFNWLGIGRFGYLPYPISSDFLFKSQSVDRAAQTEASSIRLLCAGAIRREKGQVATLQSLVDEIDDPYLKTGQVQLVVQRKKPNWLVKPKLDLETEVGNSSQQLKSVLPIEYVAHPLPRPEYCQLLQSADVGLFCYDARTYFSRCAGVLVEMLACGKPVIVPAGTWLSDQLQEPVQNHVMDFKSRYQSRISVHHDDFEFESTNVPCPGGVWSFDRGMHPFVASVKSEPEDCVAVAQFEWHWPQQHGYYVQVRCEQYDSSEKLVDSSFQTVGIIRGQMVSAILYRVKRDASRLVFRLTNAFGSDTISIRGFSLDLYSGDQVPKAMPTGAVGVIAANPKALPRCIEEMVLHFDHYRETAERFSDYWIDRHHPQQTIDRIVKFRGASVRAA